MYDCKNLIFILYWSMNSEQIYWSITRADELEAKMEAMLKPMAQMGDCIDSFIDRDIIKAYDVAIGPLSHQLLKVYVLYLWITFFIFY